jgi:hypothetical protein
MSKDTLLLLASTCLVLGFLSILASISIWLRAKFSSDTASQTAVEVAVSSARAERFAIFVGLWAPSFFALAAFFRTMPIA